MSYKLKYTGEQIDNILDRAVEGGTIDDALALKAPLESPALTGEPTAPTPAEGDDSTKVATTAYADRAAKSAAEEVAAATYITDTASGSIASFSDGADNIPMRSVKASIEPVQDLHGYDNPWPEGGGKNKLGALLSTVKTLNTSGTWNGDSYTFNGVTFTFTTTSDGYITSVIANGTATANTAVRIGTNDTTLIDGTAYIMTGCPSGGGGSTYQLGLVTSSQSGTQWDNGSGYSFTLSGTFTRCECMVRNGYTANNLTFYPMIRLSTEADATFAPYSNICPIEGYTGAEIGDSAETPALTYDIEQGTIDSDGANLGSTTRIRTKGYLSALAGESCVVHVDSAQALDAIVFFYRDNNAYISSTLFAAIPAEGLSITPPANTAKIRIVFRLTNSPSSDILPSVLSKVWLNDITFYSVSWSDEAGTVYGGNINATEGDLEDNKGRTDLGGLNWSLSSSGYFYAYFPNPDPTVIPMCEILKGTTEADVTTTHSADALIALTSAGNIIAYAPQYATAADFKTAMTGYYVVWQRKAADIVSYSIAPTEVTTNLGDNNIWSNTGDVEVEYVADPKLYIAKMLGGGTLTLGSVSSLSVNRPVTISEGDLEQAGEVSEAVEAAAETVLPAESGETEEEAQE